MLTSSSRNSKLFDGSLSLKSSSSDSASLLSTCKLENLALVPTKLPEINNNNNAGDKRGVLGGGDFQFLGTLTGNMTNPLGLTLKPPPESGVEKGNNPANSRNRGGGGGGGEPIKGGSRLDLIQAQFRQKLESEKETKLRGIFEKSVQEADRRIERITGGVGAAPAPVSRNVRPTMLMETDGHSVSSGGMMKEFFKERRDMEKKRDLTALPSIQTHLNSKRRQYQQQQQQQSGRTVSDSALKPPRYQPKRNSLTATLKPKPLSPIALAPEYGLDKSNRGDDSDGFNSTYSLSSSTLHPGEFPPSPGIGNEVAETSFPLPVKTPISPPASKVRLPPVKTKKGRSPRREPSSLSSPRENDGAQDVAPEMAPNKMVPARKAALAKRQQKAAAAKTAAMEADNMKFLDKIIEAERRKSADRRRRVGGNDVSEKGAGDSKVAPESKRREDEIMRQINQKMAELERLRSQNKDLGDRSRGSSRGGTPVVDDDNDNDGEEGENASPDPRQRAVHSSPVSRNNLQRVQQRDDEEQHQQQRFNAEEQRLTKRTPSRKMPASSGSPRKAPHTTSSRSVTPQKAPHTTSSRSVTPRKAPHTTSSKSVTRRKAPHTTSSRSVTPRKAPHTTSSSSETSLIGDRPETRGDSASMSAWEDDPIHSNINNQSNNHNNIHNNNHNNNHDAHDSSRKSDSSFPPDDGRRMDEREARFNRTPRPNDVPALRLDETEEKVEGGGGGGEPGPEFDPDLRLVECGNCGRRFKEDRLAKHESACTGQKARKKYDTKKHRLQDQDHAAYALNEKYQKEEPKKENNWREKREAFLQNMRYARGVGPAPPPVVDPDYVQCPNCERRFNKDAAERHIPKCKQIKTKSVGQKSAKGNSSKSVTKPPSSTRRR